MEFKYFPNDFEKDYIDQTEEYVKELKKQCDKRIDSLEESKGNGPSTRSILVNAEMATFIGLFACFTSCAIRCVVTKTTSDANVDFGIKMGILLGAIVFTLVTVIDSIAVQKYSTAVKKIDVQIANEKARFTQEINRINTEMRNNIGQYKYQFENCVQNLSVSYAESPLVKEVIYWMTDGFCKTIDAADRSNYIVEIRVPFEFKVGKERITCNLGTYDFEKKRCAYLNDAAEQAAVARAIASGVWLNIYNIYQTDITGTGVIVDTEEMYYGDNARITLTYIAQNGYFAEARVW